MSYMILIVFLLLSCCTSTMAADKSVSQFKATISRLEGFFRSPPILFEVQRYSKSESGILVYAHRFESSSFRYDIRKTDSLVTPFVGTYSFHLTHHVTNKCGSVSTTSGRGAANTEEAQQLVGREECWGDTALSSCLMLFTYGYVEEDRWELRSITSEPSGCSLMINDAAGRANSGRVPTKLNAPWLDIK